MKEYRLPLVLKIPESGPKADPTDSAPGHHFQSPFDDFRTVEINCRSGIRARARGQQRAFTWVSLCVINR